jgi:hypothetical protein
VNAFKLIRVVFLLSVLFVIVVGTWMTERRLASWEQPIWITIYPIAADDEEDTRRYVNRVDRYSYEDINNFFTRETVPYGVSLTPAFNFQIAPVSGKFPPDLPDRHSPVAIAWWSLKMRWWAWRMDREDGLVKPDIQVFILYHGVNGNRELDMSVGMRKGMYGLVHAFASQEMKSRNLVVIMHEIMHVLGATDKYVQATGEPEYPFGYAYPNQRPLFPQEKAEIMGGRIPLSAFVSEMPRSLEYCKIGHKTAEEIGFFAQLIE